jgi:putative transposase
MKTIETGHLEKQKYHHASHSKFVLKYHFIFVCKYRHKLFMNNESLAEEIKQLFYGIAAKAKFTIDVMEIDPSTPDHIHVLVDAPPTISPKQIASRLKSQSTFHIWKTNEEYLSSFYWKERTFWSDGYFVCTTGDASTETIKKYIERQG